MKFDPAQHYHNRAAVSPIELAKHYGKEVAWSLDGSCIVASGDDPLTVCETVRRMGLSADDVVLAYVPFPDEVVLGGAWLAEEDAP